VVSAARAEDEVRDRVLASIDGALVARHIEAAASADERVAQASKTLAMIEDRRKVIGQLFGRTGDAGAARAALDELEAIERNARRQLDRASVNVDLLTAVAADPRRWWDDADFLDRRRLLEVACDRVVVHPATPGARWDPARVQIIWRM
jgi:hypothetical protein